MAIRKTVSERIEELGPQVEARIRSYFSLEGMSYPPAELAIIVLKNEKKLEIHASSGESVFKLIKEFPILAASGHLGPKMREGDRQVPEGIYEVDFLNPNSLYHLALKLNYPNKFDRLKAQSDGRFSLGSNVMIHGNQVSSGCIAIGDPAIEDLFILAAQTGINKIKVIIAPVDFRKHGHKGSLALSGLPKWAEELYNNIDQGLTAYSKES